MKPESNILSPENLYFDTFDVNYIEFLRCVLYLNVRCEVSNYGKLVDVLKIVAPKNFGSFPGKHLWKSLFNKVESLKSATLLKKGSAGVFSQEICPKFSEICPKKCFVDYCETTTSGYRKCNYFVPKVRNTRYGANVSEFLNDCSLI